MKMIARVVRMVFVVAFAALFSYAAFADAVTLEQAKTAAKAWVARFGGMEGVRLGAVVDKDPAAYKDEGGRTLFYVADLEGGGYIVLSANTMLSPVISFTDGGSFDSNPENAEYSMLAGDMDERLKAVDESEAALAAAQKGGRRRAAAQDCRREGLGGASRRRVEDRREGFARIRRRRRGRRRRKFSAVRERAGRHARAADGDDHVETGRRLCVGRTRGRGVAAGARRAASG